MNIKVAAYKVTYLPNYTCVCGYRLEDIENVDTNQGCRGYRSENGYRSGTRYRDLSSTYMYIMHIFNVFSSPEPSGSQGELIVYPCSGVRPSVVRPSVVRRPPFSKIFSSETAWPIKAKFYMKHLWEGGTNVYINNPGHMTKMAAMPIYGKNPSKIFFSGTTGPISTKLGMKH